METIQLERRKKVVKWKTVIATILIVIAVLIGFNFASHFSIGNEYYMLQNGDYVAIGVSKDKNLIDTAIMEHLDEIRLNGFQIVDYNLESFVDRKATIANKKSFNSDAEIKDEIKESIYVVVYLEKLVLDEKEYYFRAGTACDNFIENVKQYKEDVQYEKSYEYVNIDKLTSQDELNAAIEEYAK